MAAHIVADIETAAKNNADRIVALVGDRQLSYSALLGSAQTLAEHLQSLGAKHQRIVVCLPNSFEFLIALLAVWMSGAVCVPVCANQLKNPESVRPLFNQIQPFITIVSLKDLLKFQELSSSSLVDLSLVVCLGDDGSFSQREPIASRSAATFALSRTLHHDPNEVLILYSSGTTAAPKGAIHTSDSVMHHVRNHVAIMSYEPGDSSLVCMQMDRAFCLTSQILPALVSGAALQIHEGFVVDEVLHAIESNGVTLLYGYPDYFHQLALSSSSIRNHRLRAGVAGAEMSTKATVRAFSAAFGIALNQSAGMIETLAYSFNNSVDSSKIGSAGTALRGVDLFVRNESGEGLDVGLTGEISIKSHSLMKGYSCSEPIDQPEFRTGDVGALDKDGYLWMFGRHPLSPDFEWRQLVREELYSCSLVTEAAVVNMSSEHSLVAFVVPRAGVKLEEVTGALDREITSGCRFFQLSALPRLASGKVDAAALRILTREL